MIHAAIVVQDSDTECHLQSENAKKEARMRHTTTKRFNRARTTAKAIETVLVGELRTNVSLRSCMQCVEKEHYLVKLDQSNLKSESDEE